MSNSFNSELEEKAYEVGYDKGYDDCRSEIELKIKTSLPFYLMKFCDPKPELSGLFASDLATKIADEIFGKVVANG